MVVFDLHTSLHQLQQFISQQLFEFISHPRWLECFRYGYSRNSGWAIYLSEIAAVLNDQPGKDDKYSPNDLWTLPSPQRPFGNLDSKKPSFISAIDKLKKNLKEDTNGPVTAEFIVKDNYVIVYVDGGCRRNGLENAIGAIGIWFNQNHQLNRSEILEEPFMTNNIAELTAVERCLEVCQNNNIKNLEIRTDSLYVISQIRNYQNDPKLVKTNIEIVKRICENLDGVVKIRFHHVMNYVCN